MRHRAPAGGPVSTRASTRWAASSRGSPCVLIRYGRRLSLSSPSCACCPGRVRRRRLPEERRRVLGPDRQPQRDHHRDGHRGGPDRDSRRERRARRGEPFPAPGVRRPRRPHPGGRRAGLARPGRLGGRSGTGHPGPRGLQPRAERISRQRARERGRRQRVRRRALGGRGRGVPGARLHKVRGTVDDAGRTGGHPARARGRERDGAPAAGERSAHPRGGSEGGRSGGARAAGGSGGGGGREGAGRHFPSGTVGARDPPSGRRGRSSCRRSLARCRSGWRGERGPSASALRGVGAPGAVRSRRRRRSTRSSRGTWPRAAGARRWPRCARCA